MSWVDILHTKNSNFPQTNLYIEWNGLKIQEVFFEHMGKLILKFVWK